MSTNNWAETYAEGKQAYLDKDYDRALQILKPLAEAGDSQAQITLGIMYDYGHGVPADPGEALIWYKIAANQGVPIVQHDIGVKYFQGMGVEQDYLEAAKWWDMSANAGLADSQFNLGLMHYRGLGIPQNHSKATELFQAAAAQGHGHAQYSLAVMYAFGQGMDKDYQTALELFNKSAVQGVAQAQFNLGVFYENGYGLDKDMTKAKEWFQKAAATGLQEAVEKLAVLNSQKQTMQEEQPASLPVAISGTNVSDLNKGEWLRKQRSDNYTLQLGSVINEQDIINFIMLNDLGTDASYIEVVVNGITRYTAIYGLYGTYEQAELAIQELPDSLRDVKPWIRNTGILQGLLR
ncbi:MAG: SPOR domain-containing protein [Gammaproteobacteria bacterium]